MKAKDIAPLINGKIEGDPEAEFSHPCEIDSPREDAIAFLIDPRKEVSGKVSVLITNIPPKHLKAQAIIYVEDPKIALLKILELFDKPPWGYRDIHPNAIIHPNAQVHPSAEIGPFTFIDENVVIEENVSIGPCVFIGRNTKIGKNTTIYPNVYIGWGTVIGRNVTIYPGAVIGKPGFGFFQHEGVNKRIPHVGRVIIEDECEIGSNTCIDRASIGETIIKRGTKIDNLVQIAHNCYVGTNSIIVAQSGFAGHVKIGNNVLIAGQVGVVDHVTIGDNAIIVGKAGVISHVPPNKIYMGYYARERGEYLRAQTLFYKLPEIYEIIKKLKNLIKNEKTDNT